MKKALLSALLLPALACAYQPGKTYRLTVLHTNDLHGRFWPNEHGEYGLAAQQTLVKQIRREAGRAGGSLVILNAGDINTGVPESDIHNARPDIEALNAIGYEAMTLGNHEFDNPLQLLGMQEKWAEFPFLSANTRWKQSGKPLVKPYTVLDKNGLKIAVVGLTTEDSATSGNPEYTRGIIFEPPLQAAQKALRELDAAVKPDIKIALTHMGYYHNGNHGSNAPGDVTLVRSLPPQSFDMVIGGHSHTAVCLDGRGRLKSNHKPGESCKPAYQNGTWIMQAGEWGKYLGRADFTFKNGKLTLQAYRLIPVNLKYAQETASGKTLYRTYRQEILPDPGLKSLLQKYQTLADKKLGAKIGSTNGKLDGNRDTVRSKPTSLGRLIARAQRERTRADAAIMNSGGIRDSIEAGDVTYKDILRVQPFGNTVGYAEMSGRELQAYLQTVALIRPGAGGYPQTDNLSYDVDYSQGKVSNIRVGGQALRPDQTYRLSISNYLAAGADGYPKLSDKSSYVNTGFVDAEILKQYFEQHSPINQTEFEPKGEIKVLAE